MRRGRVEEEKEVNKMTELVVALVIVVPVVLFPAALVWYLNIGGIVQTVREARKKTAAVKVAR